MILALLACAAHRVDPFVTDLVDRPRPVEVIAPADVLAAAAANPDPTPRAEAIAWLIRSEPPGGPWTARGLGDPDPWVQARAVAALGSDAAAAPALHAYATADRTLIDPYVRAHVALASPGDLGPSFAAACADDRGSQRLPACLVAARSGDPMALASLGALLADGDLPLELTFLADLANSGLSALQPSLATAAASAEPEAQVWLAAVRAGLGDPAGEADLRRMLGDPDETVRLEALDAVMLLDEPVRTRALKRTSVRRSPYVRAYVEMALGDGIERGMSSDSRDIRLLAVRFAADVAGGKAPKVAQAVAERGIVDEDPEVRARSLALVGTLGLPVDETVLTNALGDEYLDVRIAAAGAALARR